MSDTYIFGTSFADFPEGSRRRLRTFLDTAETASPYQDPLFFSGRGTGEVDLLVEQDGRPVFFALGMENVAFSRFLPGVKSLVVHKGPVADDPHALLFGLRVLKELGREKRLCEIHISPQINDEKACYVTQICSDLGFHPIASASPNMTLRLNVACNLQEILAQFRKGTRYEVKRAQRIGIAVMRAETQADFLRFYQILSRRASHKGFTTLSIADFTAMSTRMQSAPERGAVFLSEYRGDILAGALLMRAGPRVHYLYGATAAEKAGNLPGLYPVIHRGIEWAKEIGCTEFDFGGYGPLGHPLVRRFKEGFGGEIRTFVPAWRLTLMPIVPRLRRATRFFRS
jgi:hypothetical protein